MIETSCAASSGWPNGIDGFRDAVMSWMTRLCSGDPGTNAGPRLPPAWNLSYVVTSRSDCRDAG
jgi:hypothetical protein